MFNLRRLELHTDRLNFSGSDWYGDFAATRIFSCNTIGHNHKRYVDDYD